MMRRIESRIEAPTPEEFGPAVIRVIELTEQRLGVDSLNPDHDRVYDEN